MRTETIRVLLIEDSPEDAELLRLSLRDAPGGPFPLEAADRLSRGLELLAAGEFDVVLLDLTLPDGLGLETLQRFRAKAHAVPVVVLTGLEDVEVSLAALRQGAQDYLVKGRVSPDALARSLRYAIERMGIERLREEFLHNVTHEFRTPLTCIQGALEVLKEGAMGPLEARQARLVDIALSGVEQGLRSSEDLADVLRTQEGRLSIRLEEVAVGEAIGQIIELLLQSKPAKDLALAADVPEGLPPARADPMRFRQVLSNLIANAVKFTPKGGRISVSARSWEEDRGFLRVSVADTGCGIESAAAKRLFERLYQAHDPGRSRRPGLGIGLYLCRDLVTRQGGRIWVESEAGRGSTFSFTVPVFR